jgi:hypothetical protein
VTSERYGRSRTGPSSTAWLDRLTEEDLVFLKRFVLTWGSQKDLAAAYGVSYPTVRLRLGRLIEKIRVLDDESIASPFERVARGLFAEGKLDVESLKTLLDAHRAEREEADESTDRTA